MEQDHFARIKLELKEAGVTNYGMRKFAVRYLPHLINHEEHIKAIIYGRYAEDKGPKYNAGVLVATNKRVLFLDHKPGYTRSDDIDYKVVSGVRETRALFSSVTLFSPIQNYTLSFVNKVCAKKFVAYVEKRISNNKSMQM